MSQSCMVNDCIQGHVTEPTMRVHDVKTTPESGILPILWDTMPA